MEEVRRIVGSSFYISTDGDIWYELNGRRYYVSEYGYSTITNSGRVIINRYGGREEWTAEELINAVFHKVSTNKLFIDGDNNFQFNKELNIYISKTGFAQNASNAWHKVRGNLVPFMRYGRYFYRNQSLKKTSDIVGMYREVYVFDAIANTFLGFNMNSIDSMTYPLDGDESNVCLSNTAVLRFDRDVSEYDVPENIKDRVRSNYMSFISQYDAVNGNMYTHEVIRPMNDGKRDQYYDPLTYGEIWSIPEYRECDLRGDEEILMAKCRDNDEIFQDLW